MKFGVNTMVWTTQVGEKHDPLFARIKEWGFDGVEPFLSPDEPANIPAIRATLDRLQLERTTCCRAAARCQPGQLRCGHARATEWSS